MLPETSLDLGKDPGLRLRAGSCFKIMALPPPVEFVAALQFDPDDKAAVSVTIHGVG